MNFYPKYIHKNMHKERSFIKMEWGGKGRDSLLTLSFRIQKQPEWEHQSSSSCKCAVNTAEVTHCALQISKVMIRETSSPLLSIKLLTGLTGTNKGPKASLNSFLPSKRHSLLSCLNWRTKDGFPGSMTSSPCDHSQTLYPALHLPCHCI